MLAEKYKIVPVASDLDLNTATTSGDSINMKNYHKATFICGYQTLGSGSSLLTLNCGPTQGVASTAVTFDYAWMTAAAAGTDADVLTAWTSGTSVTATYGTYSNYTLVIEVSAAAMDMANGYEWLTILSTAAGGSTGNVQIHAILEPRYLGGQSVTCLE